MKRFLAALVCAVGLGCGSMPPAETARIVVSSSAAVLDLVAQLLESLERQAKACEFEPPADP